MPSRRPEGRNSSSPRLHDSLVHAEAQPAVLARVHARPVGWLGRLLLAQPPGCAGRGVLRTRGHPRATGECAVRTRACVIWCKTRSSTSPKLMLLRSNRSRRLREAIVAAFAAKADGRSDVAVKSTILIAPGHLFQAKPGILHDAGLAGMKWFASCRPGRGKVRVSPARSSSPRSGAERCSRSSAATGSRRSAPLRCRPSQPGSSRARRVCDRLRRRGVQGASHLHALPRVLPNLAHAVVCSRTEARRVAARGRRARHGPHRTRHERSARAVEAWTSSSPRYPRGAAAALSRSELGGAGRLRRRGGSRALVDHASSRSSTSSPPTIASRRRRSRSGPHVVRGPVSRRPRRLCSGAAPAHARCAACLLQLLGTRACRPRGRADRDRRPRAKGHRVTLAR